MISESVRRITVAGKIVGLMKSSINDKYTFKADIKKIDGGIWRVKVEETLFFQLHKDTEAIFDLAMVFKDDNVYGKVDSKLSKIYGVRIKGVDISDEEYNAQIEADKSWLLNEENLRGIKKKKNSIVALSLGITYLIAIGLTILACVMWNDNVDSYDKYENYLQADGVVANSEQQSRGSKTYYYTVEYEAKDGKTYSIYEKHIKGNSYFSKTLTTGQITKIIYNPNDYEDGYMAVYNSEFGHYVPSIYSSVTKHYIVSIMAIAFDLGVIAWSLLLVNQTVARYFRLLIPTGLALWSIRTAMMCGKSYYIGAFAFIVILILMLFMRVRKGFAQTEKVHLSAGGMDI